MRTAERIGGKTHFFGADASCEVKFLKEGQGANEAEFGEPVKIDFSTGARGCVDQVLFDPDRDRWTLQAESVLTFFHADDRRPTWMRALMKLRPDATPEMLPRPVGVLAARLMENYGVGSLTVVQDDKRPVVGEVVAGSKGRDGEFFPASSYFDQYLVVKVLNKTYVNLRPLRVSATIRSWPPRDEEYHSEEMTPFFDTENLDGSPAFAFGKCTIKIGKPLDGANKEAIEEMLLSLR